MLEPVAELEPQTDPEVGLHREFGQAQEEAHRNHAHQVTMQDHHTTVNDHGWLALHKGRAVERRMQKLRPMDRRLAVLY